MQLLRNGLICRRRRVAFQLQQVLQPSFGVLQNLVGFVSSAKASFGFPSPQCPDESAKFSGDKLPSDRPDQAKARGADRAARNNRSCGEALAAGTMRGRIRIRHLKSALLQIVAVVEKRSADKERAFRIDHHADIGDCTRMSRFAGPSTRSILYCRPEQPPPITATRNAPVARPCFSSSEFSFRDAFSVTLMRRSLPIL